ncbi:MAG: SDR family NAD(P)-dependent oxidoreductase [Candidatus Helarchaeota archaeon]
MKNYDRKVFVITGATGGIGSAISKKFAEKTKKLRFYLLDLPDSNFEDLEKELEARGVEHVESLECDVTNHAQVIEVINKIGEKEKYIDILVNNAGIGNDTTITNGKPIEENIKNLRKIMKINVEGPWVVTQAALPYLGRPVKKPPKKNPNQREGQVIFMSSSAGKVGVPQMAAYCASKHAVVGMANVLRQEFLLKNEKIHVITICPAPAKTKFWESTPEYKVWADKYAKKGGLYKMISAEDVAKEVWKASKGNKRERMVPKWWWLLVMIQTDSIRLADHLLIKTAKSKQELDIKN